MSLAYISRYCLYKINSGNFMKIQYVSLKIFRWKKYLWQNKVVTVRLVKPDLPEPGKYIPYQTYGWLLYFVIWWNTLNKGLLLHRESVVLRMEDGDDDWYDDDDPSKWFPYSHVIITLLKVFSFLVVVHVWLGWIRTLYENLVSLGIWYGKILPSETLFDDRPDLASEGS